MAMEGESMIAHFVAAMFNIFYAKSLTLGTWELADGVQLDKQNGKAGTLGIRLIMMLDRLGKCFYWLMHKKTTEAKVPFSYGFYANRRREQAILVHHAVTGRLLQAARESGIVFRKKVQPCLHLQGHRQCFSICVA